MENIEKLYLMTQKICQKTSSSKNNKQKQVKSASENELSASYFFSNC